MFATNDFARNVVGAAGAALLAGACLFAATAPAQASPVAVSKTVSYADLNLAQPEGRATLHARIKSAAREVCAINRSDLKARLDETRCIRTAIADATRS
ncbi:UrcA family protein [Glacieibacterium frigidum]|uniref:UrcA family protein n=1 Tax=Glacieibacterium frigidum TaxID=2593303 RepID=A0A552U7C8_9SPHN|nr:UrcA family protein [Glacieibacterium frigidum]TRW14124.1 UrcA family protein [Glacieibacterium frigidum]